VSSRAASCVNGDTHTREPSRCLKTLGIRAVDEMICGKGKRSEIAITGGARYNAGISLSECFGLEFVLESGPADRSLGAWSTALGRVSTSRVAPNGLAAQAG